jgi:secreted trypsin-like serine protease
VSSKTKKEAEEMKSLMTKLVVGTMLFSFALAVKQESASAQRANKAQRSTNVSLDQDPLLQGSRPYTEAVKRFLEKSEPKIVGGKPASAGAFPWQVSLGVSWIADPYYAHFCGGSVYSDKWIVTAAHCANGLKPSQVVITAGTSRLVASATRRNVKRIIVHKNYNSSITNNDIALIELLDPLPLDDQIKTVALLTPTAESTILASNASFVVTGWGATTEGGSKVRDLRYLENLPLIERTICNEPLSYDGRITENMICAGVLAGGQDSCQGDSGGPLTVETTTAPKLAGIVSWGEGCARPNKVGVYTRVANYIGWINTCASNSLTCNQ